MIICNVTLHVVCTELKTREERSKHYFETDLVPADSYIPDELDELYDRVGLYTEYDRVGLCTKYDRVGLYTEYDRVGLCSESC